MLFKFTNKLCYTIIIITSIICLISLLCIKLQYDKIDGQKIEVAKVISAEMCSKGAIAMQGVANTIYNRMIKYNKTAFEIVVERNQYYGYTNKNKDKIFQNKNCQQISLQLTNNIENLIDITNGALYFRMEGEKIQEWHKELTVKISQIYFYK